FASVALAAGLGARQTGDARGGGVRRHDAPTAPETARGGRRRRSAGPCLAGTGQGWMEAAGSSRELACLRKLSSARATPLHPHPPTEARCKWQRRPCCAGLRFVAILGGL